VRQEDIHPSIHASQLVDEDDDDDGEEEEVVVAIRT